MSITNRFWISLIFSLPMLAGMILMPFGWMLPGEAWTQLGLTTVIMLLSAGPFIQSAWASFTKHHANMDTLVAIGTATAYFYSIYAMVTHQAVFLKVPLLSQRLFSSDKSLRKKCGTMPLMPLKNWLTCKPKTLRYAVAITLSKCPLLLSN
ncbi:hypothetical protein L3X07_05935 [Levilactobacillus brevis]|nr:hypothetical protein [Levilactobacillus brevis]